MDTAFLDIAEVSNDFIAADTETGAGLDANAVNMPDHGSLLIGGLKAPAVDELMAELGN